MRNRFSLMYLLFSIFIIVSSIIRTALLFKALPHLDLGLVLLLKIYGTGFFFDCVTFFYCAMPFALYLTLAPDKIFNHSWHKPVVYTAFFVVIAALVFDAAAEYLFFDEFGTRYNFIAVDYLVYTREVIGNIKESYPLLPIFSAIFLVSAAIFVLIKKHIGRAFTGTSTLKQRALAASRHGQDHYEQGGREEAQRHRRGRGKPERRVSRGLRQSIGTYAELRPAF